MKNLSFILICLCIISACKKADTALHPGTYDAESATMSDQTSANATQFRTKREEIHIGDTLIGTYSAKIDLPVAGKAELQDSIIRYILSSCDIEKVSDLHHPLKTIKQAGHDFVEEAEDEMEDSGNEFFAPHTAEYKVLLEHNSSKYVTYHFSGHIYTGGAHGMPWDYHLTWDAYTGKCLTWNDLFLAKSEKKIIQLIKQAILKSEPYSQCSESDFWGFQRPGISPALTPQGIIFHYSAYEICCYAMGMPECTLPYKVLEPYMTSYAKSLVKHD